MGCAAAQGRQLVVYGGEASKGQGDDAKSDMGHGEGNDDETDEDDGEPISDVCFLDGQEGHEHFWVTLPMNGMDSKPS